jgi:hypothetical protein
MRLLWKFDAAPATPGVSPNYPCIQHTAWHKFLNKQGFLHFLLILLYGLALFFIWFSFHTFFRKFLKKIFLFHVFFGLFRNRSDCFGCFEHRNKPKKIAFGFAKQTENQPKQIEFRFVSVRTEYFYLFVSRTP